MVLPEIGCVVGIDVAKSAHVVCALEVPSGAVRLTSTPIPATAAGSAQLVEWLATWAAGDPAQLLIGLESTGSLWEPRYDAVTQAGYGVLLREPAPNRVVGHQLGPARQDRRHRRPPPGARVAGRLGTGEQCAR